MSLRQTLGGSLGSSLGSFLRSMSGRVFLILLLGIIASALLSFWLAWSEQQQAVGQFRRQHALERAEQLILTFDAMPGKERPSFLQAARRLDLPVELVPPGMPESEEATSPFGQALAERLGPQFRIRSLPAGSTDCQPRRPPPHEAGRRPPCEVLGVTLRDASMLRMTLFAPRTPPMIMPRPDFLTYFSLFLASIAILALVVTRMTMRPLKQLAQAATDLGLDLNRPPLAITGASEIRQASAAFNAMQARIRQQIAQRTQMLAAITHDLQTPLTRLRLRLEKVQDQALRDKLIDDLASMQSLVREGLDLARSLDSSEPMQALDLDSLLEAVCSDALDAGQPVTLSGHCHLSVQAHPLNLQRCLTNLLDNAVKYGQQAVVSVGRTQQPHGPLTAVIRIRDSGPGIPLDELNKVFEPFYRLESSRSRDTGGTGLGLTIARNIAEQHGGSLVLSNHPQGGLEAVLTLPGKSRATETVPVRLGSKA